MTRILVADDDPALRRLYAIWLELDGFTVVEAADGREAIEIVERGPMPHGAVLDVDMPLVDGLAVCRYLHARDPALPVVVVTGVDEAADDAHAAGAVEVLGKPCSREDLLAVLHRRYQVLTIV